MADISDADADKADAEFAAELKAQRGNNPPRSLSVDTVGRPQDYHPKQPLDEALAEQDVEKVGGYSGSREMTGQNLKGTVSVAPGKPPSPKQINKSAPTRATSIYKSSAPTQ